MKYTVVWQPFATDRLADLWSAGPDRADIASAANAIDRLLAQDPSRNGEARAGDSRILICRPLAVYFAVQEENRLVTVYAVWRWAT